MSILQRQNRRKEKNTYWKIRSAVTICIRHNYVNDGRVRFLIRNRPATCYMFVTYFSNTSTRLQWMGKQKRTVFVGENSLMKRAIRRQYSVYKHCHGVALFMDESAFTTSDPWILWWRSFPEFVLVLFLFK